MPLTTTPWYGNIKGWLKGHLFQPTLTERQMTSTNDFVIDRIRCWYYTDVNPLSSIGAGYANFVVSDRRNVRTEHGDIALVVSKVVRNDRVTYLAHVSQVTSACLENKLEKHAETWGTNWLNLAQQSPERLTVHAVRHLTRIHDITDYVALKGVQFGQSGVSNDYRFDLVAHLLYLG